MYFTGTRLWKAHLRFRLLLLHHFDPSSHSGSDVGLPWTLVPRLLPSHGACKRRDGVCHPQVIAGMNCSVRHRQCPDPNLTIAFQSFMLSPKIYFSDLRSARLCGLVWHRSRLPPATSPSTRSQHYRTRARLFTGK